VDGKKYTVFLILGLILGDNLGLNSILGFTTSFNLNYFFRFFKIPKTESTTCYEDLVPLSRSEHSYRNDLQNLDCTLTGIKTDCVFNNLIHFYTTKKFSVDILHDVVEGIFKYDMCHIVLYFVTAGICMFKYTKVTWIFVQFMFA